MAKGKYEDWLEPDNLLRLEAYARDGLTDEQIAKNIGINVKTLYDWKNNYSNISNALKKGKEVVDIEVENSLNKNANGFWYEEEVVSTKKEVTYEDGKRIKEISEPIIIKINRYKPPETMAQIYWLNNRKPTEWRQNRKEQDIDKAILDKLDKILEEQQNA